MIVWGGTDYDLFSLKTGARYRRSTDDWMPVTTTGAPASRWEHSAIWTGSKMIVWGGYHVELYSVGTLNDGAAYDPSANSWQTLRATNLLTARKEHTAVWTGSEMIIWGGTDNTGTALASGARYNPDTDSWISMSSTGAPVARLGHSAIWTGSEMIIWGGYDGNIWRLDGAGYNPVTDLWRPLPVPSISVVAGPAVWTGTEMIVWGGATITGAPANVGAAYNPATNSWRAISTSQAPSARSRHTATWTGEEMIVWGGSYGSAPQFDDGARYNPVNDRWVALPRSHLPLSQSSQTAVWTGSKMIVWGGHSANELGSYLVDSGYQYDPAARTWTETSDTNAPTPRFRHTAVWTGREMIVWGGSDYRASLKSGALYDPAQDIWSLLPEPAILAGRQGHTAVWTGSEMIVWGGVQDGTYFNDGARYNPITHTWRPMTSVGAPIARAFHTAVWTGTEMIVWGGEASDVTNTGARYDPAADHWTPVSLQNAPLARKEHTAVWTGSEMVIWGGSGGCCWTVFQDGARYDPITNRWTTITTDGAPQARMYHTAVWTGQEMIIWGGFGEGGVYDLQSGASYSPIADRWLTLTESGAPNKRVNHSVIWTGREMIVWGGSSGGRPLATGGHWHVDWLSYFPIVINSN